MGFHIYCIVPHGVLPAHGSRGVDDAGVAAADTSRLSLWYSEHRDRPVVDTAALRMHNAVIESAMSPSVTPVPLRFGQWFDSLEIALAAVAADEARWAGLLARFAGCVEYGVRVELPAASAAVREVHPAASGREYMAALAQRHAESERRQAAASQIAAEVLHSLAGVVLESRSVIDEAGASIGIAVMVARSRTDDYHAALVDLRRSRADLRFLLTGPWPPYSFVA